MINFEEARQAAFEKLSETDVIINLELEEREKTKLQNFSTVWLINTHIFLPDGNIKSIALQMAIPDEFPIVLPKIYISETDREWLGFLPHIDIKGFVCIYDEETITLDPSQPGVIAKSCLDEARKIIEQGLIRDNKEEYEDEFVAYWVQQYSKDDNLCYGLNMLNNDPQNAPSIINFLDLELSYRDYNTILFDDGNHFDRFRKYLITKGHSTIDCEALYLGTTENFTPPFNFTNAEAYEFIKINFPLSVNEFEQYINKAKRRRLILFSINSKMGKVYFGWNIKVLNIHRKGFQKNALTPLNVFQTFQKNDHVIRIKLDTYTNKRLQLRTDGMKMEEKYSITVAGLGSIGSNLIPFLMPLGVDRLQLIDPEVLSLENINRHLLGIDNIKSLKVDGIRDFVKRTNPLVDVTTSTSSIVQFIQKNAESLNQQDYLFIAVGKLTIENFILEALQERIINIPVFFLWIEPYLLGGHCLYIQPGHSISSNDLYNNYLYKHNVIDDSEYIDVDNQLLLREAGCQGSYMPYGQKSITLFLSSLTSHIYQIIENKDPRSLAFTWRNHTPGQDAASLKISEYGKQINIGSIQMKEI